MDQLLYNYADFQEEQTILEKAAKRKEELLNQRQEVERELNFRIKCIQGYFVRMSWQNKKNYLLELMDNIHDVDTILRVISFLSITCGKISSYADCVTYSKHPLQQILIDHDRTIDNKKEREYVCDDFRWISTLSSTEQLDLIILLLQVSGESLMRKMYIPVVTIYNRKLFLFNFTTLGGHVDERDMTDIFLDAGLDDTDDYNTSHPLSQEVTRLRKKFNDSIEKFRREVIEAHRKLTEHIFENVNLAENDKKSKTSKENTDKASIDWIQLLPIWIVKQIFGYFDIKTLQSLKKVNGYWSYICDGLLKEQKTRQQLDNLLEKMTSSVDPAILEECRRKKGRFDHSDFKPANAREKRLKKLNIRGAAFEDMRPLTDSKEETRECLTTSIARNKEMICDPIEKLTLCPRVIKEDLLLYRNYPCIIKDVNILIDVEDKMKRQTLSYVMSEKFFHSFSLSSANLSDW